MDLERDLIGLERDLTGALALARPHAVRAAASRLRGDHHAAEEVVAEVLARLWSRGMGSGEVYSTSYVVRCVINEVTTRWRKEQRQERIAARLATATAPGGDIGDRVAGRVDLQASIAQLPPRWREMVRHRYFDDLSQHEVAALLDVPPGSVASGLSRALRRLRADLEPALAQV